MEAPKLKPFSESAQCEKCGGQDIFFFQDPPRIANRDPFPIGIDPPPVIFAPAPGVVDIRTRYCPGGQEPEARVEDNPLATLLASLPAGPKAEMFTSSLRPRINICAGIGEEHLHKTCPRCGYEWLTKVRGEMAGYFSSGGR
jgi:hypothetical protein